MNIGMNLSLWKTIDFISIKNGWVRFGTTIRRYWKYYIIIWLVLILILPLCGVGGARLTIYSIEPISGKFPLVAYLYTFLGIEYHVTAGVFYATMLTIALSFFPIGLFSWELNKSIVSIIFQIIYPIDREYIRLAERYDNLIREIIRIPMLVAFVIFAVLLATFVNFTLKEADDLFNYFINLLGGCFISAVFVVYGIIWWQYLRILNKKHKSKCKYFRQYLLSPQRTRINFKGTVGMLTFLAILGWFLFPFLFWSIDGFAAGMSNAMIKQSEYSKKRQLIVENDKIIDFLKSSDLWIPPSEGSIVKALNIYSFMYEKKKKDTSPAPEFMYYLFIVGLLAGFLSVGLPAACSLKESFGYRRTIKRLTINVVKTIMVTSVIQLLATQAFFINMSTIKGSSAAFLFIITYFLTQEAQETYEKERNTNDHGTM